MKIIDEIKKQVEHEMLKIRKLNPPQPQVVLGAQVRRQLIELVNEGIQLKDAAKTLGITYHQAKIAYNEYKRKQFTQSENSATTVPEQRTAGVGLFKKTPHHFTVQSQINHNVISVRKMCSVLVYQPTQST